MSWLNVGKILSKLWYGVCIPDLPGFWESPLKKVFTLSDYKDVVIAFSEKIQLDNIVLLGHSNGWAIATKVVNTKTLPVSLLVLNNSAWVRNNFRRKLKRAVLKPFAFGLKTLSFLPFYNKLRWLLYRVIGSSDYTRSEEKSPFLKDTYLNMISSDLTEDFQTLDIETILLWWEKDTSTPMSDAKYMRLNIKDSELVTIPWQGHSIHIQNPIELCNTLLKHI